VKTILVPIDFSPVTQQVVAQAVILGRALAARMVLLNVTTRRSEFTDHAAFVRMIARFEPGGARGGIRKNHAADGTSIVKPIQGASLQLVGDPAEVILEQATRLSADYVVMGSHRHTALHEFVVGSTTGGVLKHAECPVVVVPPLRRKESAGRRRGIAAHKVSSGKRKRASLRIRRPAPR
jgi:nucleotide-binding universal stress UspA family protein